jgi:hypothetical protein
LKSIRFKLERNKSEVASKPVAGRVDVRKPDATAEAGIQAQAREDDQAAAQDAAQFAQRVRKRLG